MVPAHERQLDDIEDALDITGLVHAASKIYPSLTDASGTAACAEDVLADIACDRHVNESVARFRDDTAGFIKDGGLVEIGPISAASFAVLVSALEAVASAGHALDMLEGKRI